MAEKKNIVELEDVVVKFVGDSGDGMQLAGTLFSDSAAIAGNDLATFPDFPAEIRAPQNTIAGVSGFQVHLGQRKIFTSGDFCDVLVAMNPASLKANLKWAKPGATLVIDSATFDEKGIEKAGYQTNPLEDGRLDSYNLIKAPISLLTQESLKDLNLDKRSAERTKNIFALGLLYFLFNRDLDVTLHFLEKKFKAKPIIVEANKAALKAGFNYAETVEAIKSTFKVGPAKLEKGLYRNITGNIATAWGLLAASENSGRPLFLGSYPITPATEILMELAKHKSLGAKVFQAEDEIAGICSAIGASFAGSLSVTTTSGPGLSLKSEAIGLAVITELPLVIVNVQRAGPSTGMPTKSEQSDLMQALYGRNGECPAIVMAASSPANCFYFAYEAAKLSMEHMTPVILLTDGYIGFGSELFKIPDTTKLPAIQPPLAKPNDPTFKPYRRDEKTLVRQWALPGMEGLRHRIGGLEKTNIDGNVSTDPLNHQLMVNIREEKVNRVADYIPLQELKGEEKGDLLVVGWGGTEGALVSAVQKVQEEGKKVSLAHFNYIMPLPNNTAEVFSRFKKIIVCELNSGQFVNYLRMTHPDFRYHQFNKVQGLPFQVQELTEAFNKLLEDK
ncbi:MAG: 2-oxoacid:acceptor oxidoreductase subunit alpha [Bacteroides sp.]|jgi:2-oxoglutarate ferredoxin oxidoreductase subunit alpha|nr:2-oxoacid:acceptor oxidoreductase subunit alpha [Bacteroides sp.]